MYSLIVILLNNCSYSISAKNLLDTAKIKYKALNIEDKDKDIYVTYEIDTFPQIYLANKTTKNTLLLGGYSDLKYFYDLFINNKYSKNNNKYSKINNENYKKFLSKYQLWTKKSLLRLCEIFQ